MRGRRQKVVRIIAARAATAWPVLGAAVTLAAVGAPPVTLTAARRRWRGGAVALVCVKAAAIAAPEVVFVMVVTEPPTRTVTLITPMVINRTGVALIIIAARHTPLVPLPIAPCRSHIPLIIAPGSLLLVLIVGGTLAAAGWRCLALGCCGQAGILLGIQAPLDRVAGGVGTAAREGPRPHRRHVTLTTCCAPS